MVIRRILFALIFVFAISTIAGGAETGKTIDRVEGLVKGKKYREAAELLLEDNRMKEEPVLFARYVELMTGYYSHTLNFRLFALRDLGPDEKIEDVRGSEGDFVIIGGDLEEDLKEMEEKYPENGHVMLAVGYYISRALTCGCAGGLTHYEPSPETEYRYFKGALDRGVSDGWSLFRLGMMSHRNNDVEKAKELYEKSMALGYDNPSLFYNSAIIYFQARDYPKALGLVDRAIEEYEDASLLADACFVKGVILEETGETEDAAAQYKRGLKLVPWHPDSFRSLASLLKKTGKNEEYSAVVKEYIALDYGNSFLFNRYIEVVERTGITDVDLEIEKHLLTLEGLGAKETGAVYFNLGVFADMRERRDEAVERYKKSLKAFGEMETPPDGAVEALKARLAELEKGR